MRCFAGGPAAEHPVVPHLEIASPRRRQIATIVCLAMLFACTATSEGAAQPPTSSPEVGVEAISIPFSEIPTQAVHALGVLRTLASDLQPKAAIATIEAELPAFAEQTRDDAVSAVKAIAAAPSDGDLNEVNTRWRARRREIESWSDALLRRSAGLEAEAAEIARMGMVWTKTREQAVGQGVPGVVRSRIDEVLLSLETVGRKVEVRRAEILTAQEELGSLRIIVDGILEQSRIARSLYVDRLWVPQQGPLWELGDEATASENTLARIGRSLSLEAARVREYLVNRPVGVIVHLIGTLLVAVLLRRGRRSAKAWVEEEPALGSVAQTFAVPYSTALLLSFVVVPWLYPLAPRALMHLIGVLALLPAIRLLQRLCPPGMFAGLYCLAAFYVVNRLRSLIAGPATFESILFLVEMIAALVVTRWFFSDERIRELGWETESRQGRMMHAGRAVLSVLFAVAAAATVLGYLELGRLIGDGAMGSALAAVLLYASVEAARGLWTYILRSRAARSLRAVRHHRWLLQVRGNRAITYMAALAWVVATLNFFALLTPLWERGVSILSARLTRGNLSVSLGDVAVFVASVWGAILLSRFIRFVLNEDVFPRVKVAHGVPYALSTLLHYVLVIGGFLFGIAAIGFDASRFAIVAGALGVGIGFGLQNVVNNFVSGLILLFERPVQVGDAVELGTLTGEVRRIGIRSSTIRTWDGADVIVPNGSLISDTVTNWTLTDRSRRIEVPIGVAYGTDAKLVIDILIETVKAHPEISSVPAPMVLFTGFGDSSLDFLVRAWTANYDRWVVIRSDLMVAIQTALAEAEIEIPFPQRDLHLRTVDAEALASGQAIELAGELQHPGDDRSDG